MTDKELYDFARKHTANGSGATIVTVIGPGCDYETEFHMKKDKELSKRVEKVINIKKRAGDKRPAHLVILPAF